MLSDDAVCDSVVWPARRVNDVLLALSVFLFFEFARRCLRVVSRVLALLLPLLKIGRIFSRAVCVVHATASEWGDPGARAHTHTHTLK